MAVILAGVGMTLTAIFALFPRVWRNAVPVGYIPVAPVGVARGASMGVARRWSPHHDELKTGARLTLVTFYSADARGAPR